MHAALPARGGAGLDSPLVRYLTLPVVPVQLGFDPRLQLLPADDATGAIAAAVRTVRGAVNVGPPADLAQPGAAGVGRPALPIPHPLFEPVLGRLGGRLGAGGLLGDGIRLLRFGRGVDITRLREEVGFVPRLDAVGAVRDLAAKVGGRRVGPGLHPGELLGDSRGAAIVSDETEAATAGPELVADFLRGVRVGVEAGLDPLAAAHGAAESLPGQLRGAFDAIVQRMRGEYREDEWGFDEQFAEAVFPLFEFLLRRLVAGEAVGEAQCALARSGRCWSPTTPARSFPSTRPWSRRRS